MEGSGSESDRALAPDESAPRPIRTLIRTVGESIADWMWPLSCLRCRGDLPDPESRRRMVCWRCHPELPWLAEGQPAPAPPLEWQWATFRYSDPVRAWIHEFKYRRRTFLRKPLAALMAARRPGWLDCFNFEALVPMPIHDRRLRDRRFHQTRLLAEALGEGLGLKVDDDILRRSRFARPQVGLETAERSANVEGTFFVPAAARTRLEGSTLLLIDDVVTTGSTALAAAGALREAGAGRVALWTLARAHEVGMEGGPV